jgi:RNA polymerase sigma-70 factor (ECF subfamily)
MISCLPAPVCPPDEELAFQTEPRSAPAQNEEIETLGRRCVAGEFNAWDSLFSAVWPVLVTFVHRLYHTFDKEDAEDVAQATLETAIRQIDSFAGKGSFRGWLFGIAAKQAATLHRRRGAQKRGNGRIIPLSDGIDWCDEAAKSPSEIFATSDRCALIHRALSELEEADRDLVQLHFFGELTFREIAVVRKMNAKTVATRLTRARAKMCVILARFNLTQSDG